MENQNGLLDSNSDAVPTPQLPMSGCRENFIHTNIWIYIYSYKENEPNKCSDIFVLAKLHGPISNKYEFVRPMLQIFKYI